MPMTKKAKPSIVTVIMSCYESLKSSIDGFFEKYQDRQDTFSARQTATLEGVTKASIITTNIEHGINTVLDKLNGLSAAQGVILEGQKGLDARLLRIEKTISDIEDGQIDSQESVGNLTAELSEEIRKAIVSISETPKQ